MSYEHHWTRSTSGSAVIYPAAEVARRVLDVVVSILLLMILLLIPCID